MFTMMSSNFPCSRNSTFKTLGVVHTFNFKYSMTTTFTGGKQWYELQKEVSVFCSRDASGNFHDCSKGQKGINKGRSQWLS